MDNLIYDLSIVAKPGEEKEICIIHYNKSSKDIYLWWWFPDNAKEPNWGFNCSSNYLRDNPFSKFIKPFEEKFIKVPANWYVIRKTTIKFPVWVNWIQKWCFAYWEDPWDLKWWQIFLFITRKIHYLNVLVEWDAKIENKIKISKIKTTIDENKKLQIEFNIENNWSTDEIVNIDWEISSMLWYKKTFSIQWKIITTNNNQTINTKDSLTDIEIPRYKWPFTIKLKVNYKPYFDFDVSKYWFDPKKLEWTDAIQTKTIFFFPTIPLIWIIIFIILIYLAFFRKPKVIIQQAPIK